MKIEILLPVDNTSFLPLMVDSLVAQTEKDWALQVILNGLSKEEKVKAEGLLKQVTEKGKEVILTEKGVRETDTACLNEMANRSKAEVVFPAQQEDIWNPNKVKFLGELMQMNPTLSASATEAAFINEEGRLSGGWTWLGDEPAKVEKWCRMNKSVLPHAASVVRRGDLLEVGGWDAKMEACFETDLWIRLVQSQKMVLGVAGSKTRYTMFRKVDTKYTENRKNLMRERDVLKERYRDKWERWPGYKFKTA